jgi:hypothetical protein
MNGGTLQHGSLCQLIDYVDLEVITLHGHACQSVCPFLKNTRRTLEPVMRGPGT